MKKFTLLLAMLAAFCFSAAAQFSFTSFDGVKYAVKEPPQHRDPRGSLTVDYYYTVEGSNLIVYEVPVSQKDGITSISVTTVPLDSIRTDRFTPRKNLSGRGCYMQTGRPFTKYWHSAAGKNNDTYSDDNLELTFTDCDSAEAFRQKVTGGFSAEKKDDEVDKALADLDLDLDEDSAQKKKPANTMPAHLFALLGDSGSKRSFQFNRRNNEVWDYTSNDVFKVASIAKVSDGLRLLDKDGSYFTYAIREGETYSQVYNGNKALGYSIIDGGVCKSIGGGKCEIVYRISREDGFVYKVIGSNQYTAYRIKGEASDDEIVLLLALLEKL